jgi:hypothetical protein
VAVAGSEKTRRSQKQQAQADIAGFRQGSGEPEPERIVEGRSAVTSILQPLADGALQAHASTKLERARQATELQKALDKAAEPLLPLDELPIHDLFSG